MSNIPMDLVPTAERDNFLTRLAETIGSKANASSVFGEPITNNGVTVVPVARARWGCGGGGGQDTKESAGQSRGFGGGGGMVVKPVGYLVVRGEDVEYREIDRTRDLLAALAAGIAIGAIWRRRRARP